MSRNQIVRGLGMVVLGVWGFPGLGLGAESFPEVPELILGVNAYGLGEPAKVQNPEEPSWNLTDADLERLKSIGVNTVRFPVYPASLGIDGTRLVWKAGDSFDEHQAGQWPVDWRLLDAVLDQLARHQLTPYLCPHPHPPNWMTLYIPEDAERCFWYTRLTVRHVHEKYGDHVLYGWYENIWKNSLEPWQTGAFRHTLSTRFPAEWHRMLREMYDGRIESLNVAWQTHLLSFEEAPLPNLGSGQGVPDRAYACRPTYDLRQAIDLLSRERLQAWRKELRQLAPGAVWMGACLHGFYGMHDTGAGHPPKCNWGLRTHAQTSDALAADNYEREARLSVFYRTVAKVAASEGKSYLVAELNAARPEAFDALARVGGPLRGVLVWCAKEDQFGLIAADGTPREKNLQALGDLFQVLREQRRKYATYRPGRVRVYYPEETYENAVLRRSHLDAYEHVCDTLLAADLEPVLTAELDRLPPGVPLFVLEKHLPRKAIASLNRLGRRVVCFHRFFIDENGKRVRRPHAPADFYAHLRAAEGGPALLEAFLRVEEKERNVGCRDTGATARTSSAFLESNEISPGQPYDVAHVIDGDAVASRVVFADKPQPEGVDVTLSQPQRIDGAFVETAVEDPGRTPDRVRILVSMESTDWAEVANVPQITTDRTHLRFPPVEARYVRFDLGGNTDGVGTRLMEVGVLGEGEL